MSYLIKIIGAASGVITGAEGEYVEYYNPEGEDDGKSIYGFTDEKGFAMRYPTIEAAFQHWNAVRLRAPLRSDGKPDRPLTAFSVEFEEVDDEPTAAQLDDGRDFTPPYEP